MDNNLDSSRLQEFSALELIARQAVEGFIIGLHKSPFHGFSVEFAEHRLHNPGESTRHIDWKLFGRTDRLYSKRFEEETNLRCQVIIDHSSSMYYPVIDHPTIENPDKITFSVHTAAAILYLLKKQRDAFGLSVFSDRLETHIAPRSNSVHQKYIFSELEKLLRGNDLQQKRPTLASEVLHQMAESLHKRSLIVIFSDMMESQSNPEVIFDALQHLRHNKHEVILFHTVDRSTEIDFAFANRPYRFVDMESGDDIRLLPNEVRAEYVNYMNRFSRELQLRCAQYQVDFVEADIKKGFRQILLPYLLKREKLF
ncbi:MAG: DUF58 domain-containing protein [Bacteroidales bacterium]|nr:DUF58 domain-containing protein [Bacteroidales bacterium]MDZ4205007.1 DUF58 domain-containing protein [Bacteroidales bacterium]